MSAPTRLLWAGLALAVGAVGCDAASSGGGAAAGAAVDAQRSGADAMADIGTALDGSAADAATGDGAEPDAASAPDDADGTAAPPPASPDPDRAAPHLALTLDLGALRGVARITLAPSGGTGASLRVDGLAVSSVRQGDVPLSWAVTDGRLDVGVPPSPGSAPEITVEYTFQSVAKGAFEGYMASGSTVLWPEFCGNLFPCRPHPSEGLTFTLDVGGLPPGQVAVHPKDLPAAVPAYTVAFAVGDYSYVPLGTTPTGTALGYWTLPSTVQKAQQGTQQLLQHFGWMEAHLGPYTLGASAGPVAVDWGPFAYGGIEHHPLWHVSTVAFGDPRVHAHEAAHGWFGTGLRLLCWEDLVLSEGTADYLAGRVIEVTSGAEAGEKVFQTYRNQLGAMVAGGKDAVAWPGSCNAIDVLHDLFSQIPYLKGALFFRALSALTGADPLDDALGAFYSAHRNEAATMQELLGTIQTRTGVDPGPLALAWLRGLGVPEGM